MVNDMEWEIKLFSDISVTAKLLPDGNISISTFPEILSEGITWENDNGRFFLYVFKSPFAIIYPQDPEPVVIRTNLTAVELRSAFVNLNKMSFNERAIYINNISLLRNSTEKNAAIRNDTDLHTHFLEVLSGKEFMEVISRFTDEIPVSDDATLFLPKSGEKGMPVSLQEIIVRGEWNRICEQLSIGIGGQVPFDYLFEVSSRRTSVINHAIERYCVRNGKNPNDSKARDEARKDIYIAFLNKIIDVYKGMHVKYVELSYSTKNTIMAMVDYLETPEGQEKLKDFDLGFLYSVSRKVTMSSTKKDEKEREKEDKFKRKKISKQMEEFEFLIEHDYVDGFDFMGEEFGLTVADMKDMNDPKTFISIMNNVLRILNGKDKVLRIHAGENYESRYNPLLSLQVIQKLIKDYNYSLPQIRIGHGLYMPDDDKDLETYADLLINLHVIVEINATSNFTLSNVNNLYQIPYEWYQSHKIPVVLGTDGPGMYLTDTKQERLIARVNSDQPKHEFVEGKEVVEPKKETYETDYELLQIYKNNHQEGTRKLIEKYKDEIRLIEFLNVYKKNNNVPLKDFHPSSEKPFIEEIFTRGEALISRKKDYVIGDLLNDTIKAMEYELYQKSNLGISFEHYCDYLALIAYTDEDLREAQDRNFDFVYSPITNEKEQVLYVASLLEHYLFDLQSNEVIYDASELVIFNQTISHVRDYVKQNQIQKAQAKLVALQVFFGLNVTFLPMLKRVFVAGLPIKALLDGVPEYDLERGVANAKPSDYRSKYGLDEPDGGDKGDGFTR